MLLIDNNEKDLRVNLYKIIVFTGIIANVIGVVLELFMEGSVFTPVVCGVFALALSFMFFYGLRFFGFQKAMMIVVILFSAVEFPFFYFVYGISKLPFYYLSYVTIGLFARKVERTKVLVGYTIFNLLHIVLFTVFSPFIVINDISDTITAIVSFFIVSFGLFFIIVQVNYIIERKHQELLDEKEEFINYQSLVKNVNAQLVIDLNEETCNILYIEDEDVEGNEVEAVGEVMKQLIDRFCDEANKEKMLEFTNLSSLSYRIRGKKSLSQEYHSKEGGWRRASFYPVEIDDTGRLSKVLFVVQPIDGEVYSLRDRLQIEETLVECIKTATSSADTDLSVKQLLKIIANYHGAEKAFIYSIDRQDGFAEKRFVWSERRESKNEAVNQFTVQNLPKWYPILMRGRCISVINERDRESLSSAEKKFVEKHNIERLIVAPIHEKNRNVSGFIGVLNPTKNLETEVLMASVTSFIKEEFVKADYVKNLQNLSNVDSLTGFMNRRSYVEYTYKLNKNGAGHLGVVLADINRLKTKNDQYGYEAGDKYIVQMADILKNTFKSFEPKLFRIGGGEFVIIIENIDQSKFEAYLDDFVMDLGDVSPISVGEIWINTCVDYEEQIKQAEKRLHERKRLYFVKSGLDRRESTGNRAVIKEE